MITCWKNNCPPGVPYYAVIFISKKGEDLEGYEEMDDFLMELAHKQKGFLGYSSASKADEGIFISYWKDKQSIDLWCKEATHLQAKEKGYEKWYDYVHSLICKVEASHIFER
jgi:heme-degrading monooxygenase HmoA